MSIEMQDFGATPAGEPVRIFTLSAPGGDAALCARITNYGGVIVNLWAPDAQGQAADVVLGFDTLDEYIALSKFFGCLVGRFANRIAGGTFELNGTRYQLATNGGPNHIHGGPVGFDKVVWQAETAENAAGEPVLRLRHHSPDGDQGYPGALDVEVVYTVTRDNALRIDYTATTDAPTILNLTNHSYFNLGNAATILDHVVTLHADAFTPVNENLIPTGELASVKGTPFDFRTPTSIGARIDENHPQLQRAGGYDHNWVLGEDDGTLRHVATVVEPQSGRRLELHTTQPGVQFYTGNFLPPSMPAKAGQSYTRRAGFCLETQHFPNSPNQPDFPSVVLNPGETFRQMTLFAFGVQS